MMQYAGSHVRAITESIPIIPKTELEITVVKDGRRATGDCLADGSIPVSEAAGGIM